jgi:hypothetical protein
LANAPPVAMKNSSTAPLAPPSLAAVDDSLLFVRSSGFHRVLFFRVCEPTALSCFGDSKVTQVVRLCDLSGVVV